MKSHNKNKLFNYFFYVNIILCLFIFLSCEKKSNSNVLQNNNFNNENQILSNTNSELNNESPFPQTQKSISDEKETVKKLEPSDDILNEKNNEQTIKQSLSIDLVLIPNGTFQMGNDNDFNKNENPAHQVTVSAFYLGKFEISQKEYMDIMESNPSSFKGENKPVENVSWFNAIDFCNRLSIKDGLQPVYTGEGDVITYNASANGYRLPTEAEWEYAAVMGRKDISYKDDDEAALFTWFNVNSNGITQNIGTKAANIRGLHDMSGNVAEWCWDRYDDYGKEKSINPTGAIAGNTRVVRGGSWGSNVTNLRISARTYYAPTVRNSSIGFRVARSAL